MTTTHPLTLDQLLEERERQDRAFARLCAAISTLDDDQRIVLSDACFEELETAWRVPVVRAGLVACGVRG